MLTEEQAARKWCPMARVCRDDDDRGYTSFNRASTAINGTNIPPSCRCIASECMAWRWAKPPMLTRRIYLGSDEEAALGPNYTRDWYEFEGATWRYESTSSDSRGIFRLFVRSSDDDEEAHGYCGAFGKPGDE